MGKTQQVERLAMAFLVNALENDGVMVATPMFDSGIDFVAYRTNEAGKFDAVPVQLKSSTKKGFYTNKKYLQIPGLKIIYMRHVDNDLSDVRAFCMPYPLAEKIVDEQERSRKDGAYFTQGSQRLEEALVPYEVDNWNEALFG
jgi:hypothetical protein